MWHGRHADTRFRSSIVPLRGCGPARVWGPLPGADCRGCSWSLMSALDVSGTAVAQGRAAMARPAGRPTATGRVGRCTSTAPGRSVDHRPPARRARGHQISWAGCTQGRPERRRSCNAPQRRDCFVPKQLGWGLCHGLAYTSSAVLVRWRTCSSAAVRQRCWADWTLSRDVQPPGRRCSSPPSVTHHSPRLPSRPPSTRTPWSGRGPWRPVARAWHAPPR